MKTSFESNNNVTATYNEAIEFYKQLAASSPKLQINPYGMTDIGKPLHEVILSTSEVFDPQKIKDNGKAVLFINNAIHPGEPCGVDASMMLIRNILQSDSIQAHLEHVVIVLVPFYNIGGTLNRNSHTRANQEGPESYGFRGNAQNLDLNRDFIKCDSKNAKSFNQLFNKWNPEVMIDNHTSNGADYQYTMTIIATQKDKLEHVISNHMTAQMLPFIYDKMIEEGWESTPYVFSRNTPDEGIYGFLDLPRYSSGYAALHNTISFMPETHMLKPYSGRVMSTYAFMKSMIAWMSQDHENLINNKLKAIQNQRSRDSFEINWTQDYNRIDSLNFKGYEAKYKPSKVTGQSRLYYDQNAPYEKSIPFYNSYKPSAFVTIPKKYIIPQAYQKVVDRLIWNGVELKRLETDTIIEVEVYYVVDYKTSNNAFEGHYLHSNISVESKTIKKQYYSGDYIVETDQDKKRYIAETLEPVGPDSFFAWNFFDGILMQKEYFSSYVFEDLAAEILENNPALKEQLRQKKNEDSVFAEDGRAQLKFIYENSAHKEITHRLYPIGRLNS